MYALIDRDCKNWINFETAYRGLSEMGYMCISTRKDDLSIVNDNEVFYGNVGFVEKALELLGYPKRAIAHVPDDLMPFAGRIIETVTLSEALQQSKTQKIFIKPKPEKHKFFTGMVLNSSSDLLNLANYDNDELVLMSPAINILSEWRCYICDGEVLDVKHYKGDFRIHPCYETIDHAAKSWKSCPVAWALDVGITDDGKTIVVECNDVMSLGFYGLSTLKAGKMLRERWDEIHRNKSL